MVAIVGAGATAALESPKEAGFSVLLRVQLVAAADSGSGSFAGNVDKARPRANRKARRYEVVIYRPPSLNIQ